MERALVLWNFMLYFSACGTHSSIMEFRVIFFCIWNALYNCGISFYIFLSLEHALVLWNFVLYFSTCGMRSGIMEFHVIFSHVLKVLVDTIQLLFLHVCCIFRVVFFHVVFVVL